MATHNYHADMERPKTVAKEELDNEIDKILKEAQEETKLWKKHCRVKINWTEWLGFIIFVIFNIFIGIIIGVIIGGKS